MRLTLDHTINHSLSVRSYYFRQQQPLRFDAGQFIELILKTDADTAESRYFTLANSPDDEFLVITTRHSPNDSPYKRALAALVPGDAAETGGLLGDFVLPMDPARPLIFVAAGIGITPFRSMLRWLLQHDDKRDITLLYEARTPQDLIFQEDIEAYGLSDVSYVCTRPPVDWQGIRGPLTADSIVQAIKPLSDPLIYIAGPELLVQELTDSLTVAGIDKEQIVSDYFTGYSAGL